MVGIANGVKTPTSCLLGVPIHHTMEVSTNIIYLDFDGHAQVRKDALQDIPNQIEFRFCQNASRYRNGFPAFSAYAYSIDDDPTTFNDEEKAAMSEIWLRIAEDYAPFDVDCSLLPWQQHNVKLMLCRLM